MRPWKNDALFDALALSEKDTVATAVRAMAAGETVRINSPSGTVRVRVAEDIPLCHKLAVRDITAGEAVIKFGEFIGEAAADIVRGALVHTHNLRGR